MIRILRGGEEVKTTIGPTKETSKIVGFEFQAAAVLHIPADSGITQITAYSVPQDGPELPIQGGTFDVEPGFACPIPPSVFGCTRLRFLTNEDAEPAEITITRKS